MSYPSTITAFTNPLPTDRLNSPSHSSIETAQNTGLTDIMNYVGVDGASSVVGTLIYAVRSPASDGGGHVQTASKGGTGQTTYTKGDVLVASNSSTLSKIAVGADNQILASNSSTASGINWVNSPSSKVSTSASVVTITEGTVGSVYSVTLPGSTLGISNAVRTTIPITQWGFPSQNSVMAVATYGGQRIGSVMLSSSSGSSIVGEIRHTIIANNSATAQRHIIQVNGSINDGSTPFNEVKLGSGIASSVLSFGTMAMATSSINSSANQTLGMEVRLVGSNGLMNTGGYVVEKIT